MQKIIPSLAILIVLVYAVSVVDVMEMTVKVGGIYPDLTKRKMLGIEVRENFLKSMLKYQ